MNQTRFMSGHDEYFAKRAQGFLDSPVPTLMRTNVFQIEAARRPFMNRKGLHCENAYRLLAWVYERVTLDDETRAAMIAERDGLSPESA